MSGRARRSALLGLAFALWLVPSTVSAQVAVGVAAHRDRVRWHFENPSSYDTPTLVPHSFEQDYRLDNLWLTARASYRAGVDWQTSVGATLTRIQPATDYDTFFNPGGVTWVSGTSGDARTHGLQVSQDVDLGRLAGARLTGGYRLRVDLADFLEGDRTDTRNGVLISRSLVTTREFTNGQLHDVFVAASHTWTLTPRWTARLAGDLSPAAVSRLAIRLPDKYPGRTLVYRTTTAMASGRLELTGGPTQWPVTMGLSAGRTWRYSSTQWAQRSSLTVGLTVGRGW